MNEKLFIVMPAYNEEGSIENVVKQWYPDNLLHKSSEVDGYLVVADSGSTDHTHEILINMQKDYPKLLVFDNTEKQHGPKLMFMYKYAIEKGADYIFQTDSDGQTNPDEFIDFWNERKKSDVIIGVRKTRGDGYIRLFVEKVVCLLLRIFFDVRVEDANAPFRLMKSSVVSKYIEFLPVNYNLPNIMMTAFWVHNAEKVSFREISFGKRETGKNSINIVKIVKIGIHTLADFRELKKKFF